MACSGGTLKTPVVPTSHKKVPGPRLAIQLCSDCPGTGCHWSGVCLPYLTLTLSGTFRSRQAAFLSNFLARDPGWLPQQPSLVNLSPGLFLLRASAVLTLPGEPAAGLGARPRCARWSRSAALTSLLLHVQVHVRRGMSRARAGRCRQKARVCRQPGTSLGVG